MDAINAVLGEFSVWWGFIQGWFNAELPNEANFLNQVAGLLNAL